MFQDLENDLKSLKDLSNEEFNIFNSIGMARQEIKHSRTLGTLLTPRKDTKTPEKILKRFMKEFLPAPMLKGIDSNSLGQTTVTYEKEHIDILIVNKEQKFIIAIENKIDAGETGDQLSRYIETMQESNFDYSVQEYQHFYLYLTISGEAVPDKNRDNYRKQWIPVSHKDVLLNVLKKEIVKEKHDFQVLLNHYIRLMETTILGTDMSHKQSRKLYQTYRNEIDSIISVPLYEQAVEKISRYIDTDSRFIFMQDKSKTYNRFIFKSWKDEISIEGYGGYKNIDGWYLPVALELVNETSGLIFIKLIIPLPNDYLHKDTIRKEIKINLSTHTNCKELEEYDPAKYYCPLWKYTHFPTLTLNRVFEEGSSSINEWWDTFVTEYGTHIENTVLEVFKKYQKQV